MAAAGRRLHAARRAARRAGRGPGRARDRRRVVGVADLRHHHRPGRADRLRPDHLRRPAMAPPGPRRAGPGRRPRHRPPAGPGRNVVIGPVIRAIRHPWRPVLAVPTAPSAARGDHRLIRQREDEPDDAAVGRLVRRRQRRAPAPGRGPAAAGRAGLQGRPGRARQSRTDPPPAARRGRPPGRDLAR